VVTLQVIFFTALFAFAAFGDNLSNNFSTAVLAFACAAVPFWVVTAAHFFSPRFCHAENGAILASAPAPFTYLKLHTTFFTATLQQCLRLTRAKFLRAFPRTRVGCSSDMRVWARKNFAACGARQRGMSTSFNGSLELSHG
jgi:hypothetical protein